MLRSCRRLLRRARAAVPLAILLAAGCSSDLFHDTEWLTRCASVESCGSGQGAGGASGSAATVGGGGSSSGPCEPGASRSCYSGAAGTEDVGACTAGTQICDADGAGYGPCTGEITPKAELCGDGVDDDCNDAIDDCVITSCAALHTAQPTAPDGLYSLDPDGAGALAAVPAYCDMTTDGGGWTLLAKTVVAGLTAAEMAKVREGLWVDYAELGYGDPDPAARIYWMPLLYWHALTSDAPPHDLSSRTGTTEVRVGQFALADEAGKFAWSWQIVMGSIPLWAELNGAKFTARDADNDTSATNCSKDNVGLNGGFWYTSCGQLSMLHHNGNVYRLDDNVKTAVEYNKVWLR